MGVSFEMMSSRDFFVLSTLPDHQILEKLIGGDKVKRPANYVGMIEVRSSLKPGSMSVHEIQFVTALLWMNTAFSDKISVQITMTNAASFPGP